MADTKTKTTTKVVKYVGTANVREIDANSWKSIDVEDQGKVVWSQKNRWKVPATDLSEAALRYLDEDDSGFVVVEE